MNDSFPTPERERRMTTPIEIMKLSNGARTAVITVVMLLLVNICALVVYIVKDHERQSIFEEALTSHLDWAQDFQADVNEMKLDIRELTVRFQYVEDQVIQHRETEP